MSYTSVKELIKIFFVRKSNTAHCVNKFYGQTDCQEQFHLTETQVVTLRQINATATEIHNEKIKAYIEMSMHTEKTISFSKVTLFSSFLPPVLFVRDAEDKNKNEPDATPTTATSKGAHKLRGASPYARPKSRPQRKMSITYRFNFRNPLSESRW